MIYTIGRTEAYEQYFREQENPQKAVGGSVWEFWKSAWWFTVEGRSYFSKQDGWYGYKAFTNNGYSVYGVVASWKWDTVDTGNSWHNLIVPASLIKVRKEWGGTL